MYVKIAFCAPVLRSVHDCNVIKPACGEFKRHGVASYLSNNMMHGHSCKYINNKMNAFASLIRNSVLLQCK